MKIKNLCSYAPKSKIKAGEAVENAKYLFFTSSADENKRYTDFQFDKEAIIMGTGGNATLHYYNGKFSVSTDCLVLLPNSKIKCKYLYYFFKSHMSVLEAGFKGAGLKHTNKKYIEEINIREIPDLTAQEKIISHLDTISENVEKLKRELELFDSLTKARFIELFGDSEHNTRNWPTAKLSSLCYVGSSKRIHQSELTDNGIPFLRISDLNERIDGKDNAPQLFISTEKFDELRSNRLIPLAGDVLVTTRGTLGRCYIIKESDSFYFQDGMISLLSNICDSITSLYVSELFATTGVQKQIANLQAGSTVAYLSITMLKKLDIMLPPLALQNQFAAFVEQVDKSKLAVQQSLEKTQQLFDSLMQEYFG